MTYYPQQPYYQTPAGYGPNPPTGQLTAVGVSLIIAASLNFLWNIVDLPFRAVALYRGDLPAIGGADPTAVHLGAIAGLLANVLGIILCPIIIGGAIFLLRHRGLMFARLAVILACIPMVGCCCILQIPFGVWGLVLLNRQDVKNLFT